MEALIRPYVPKTGRELGIILARHELEASQFAGKTVLDLGCGRSMLGDALHRLGIQADVTGVDADPEQLNTARSQALFTTYVEDELGTRLPFDDESIDIILATCSLPLWSRDARQISAFFSENRRMLKRGGLLSISPMFIHSSGLRRDIGLDAEREIEQTVKYFERSTEWITRYQPRGLFQATKLR